MNIILVHTKPTSFIGKMTVQKTQDLINLAATQAVISVIGLFHLLWSHIDLQVTQKQNLIVLSIFPYFLYAGSLRNRYDIKGMARLVFPNTAHSLYIVGSILLSPQQPSQREVHSRPERLNQTDEVFVFIRDESGNNLLIRNVHRLRAGLPTV